MTSRFNPTQLSLHTRRRTPIYTVGFDVAFGSGRVGLATIGTDRICGAALVGLGTRPSIFLVRVVTHPQNSSTSQEFGESNMVHAAGEWIGVAFSRARLQVTISSTAGVLGPGSTHDTSHAGFDLRRNCAAATSKGFAESRHLQCTVLPGLGEAQRTFRCPPLSAPPGLKHLIHACMQLGQLSEEHFV